MVAKVPGVVARVLLGYPGWLLRCCLWLLRYPRWLLSCCYAVAMVPGVVARVPEVVAKVLLCGCYGTWGGC